MPLHNTPLHHFKPLVLFRGNLLPFNKRYYSPAPPDPSSLYVFSGSEQARISPSLFFSTAPKVLYPGVKSDSGMRIYTRFMLGLRLVASRVDLYSPFLCGIGAKILCSLLHFSLWISLLSFSPIDS